MNFLVNGISCYNLNGNHMVTIGYASPEQKISAGAIVGGFVGSLAGTLIEETFTNPPLEKFNIYSNKKVVYINCLFEKKWKSY